MNKHYKQINKLGTIKNAFLIKKNYVPSRQDFIKIIKHNIIITQVLRYNFLLLFLAIFKITFMINDNHK